MSLEIISHRWLQRQDELPWVINGIAVDPATRTRREEYTWALNAFRAWAPERAKLNVLDAASGYVPDWHMLPDILNADAQTPMCIYALDINEATTLMPEMRGAPKRIYRGVCDMRVTGFAAESIDVVCCLSVLEHLSAVERQEALDEFERILSPGGLLLLTADYGGWLISDSPMPPCEPALSPPVYAVAARRLR